MCMAHPAGPALGLDRAESQGLWLFCPVLCPSAQSWATARSYISISGRMLLCGNKKAQEFRKFWGIKRCPGRAEKGVLGSSGVF